MSDILRLAIVVSLISAYAGVGHAQEQASLAREGKTIAASLCRDCHKISRDQVRGPLLQPRAPSFPAIANQLQVSDEQLQEFLKSPSHSRLTKRRMPDLPLSDDYIERLVAYIASLRKK